MGLFGSKRIFLDHAAGRNNPSAIYKEGLEAKRVLEDSRRRVARILGVQTRDIVFTSGGTESDNLALLGAFEYAKDKISNPHVIISYSEHPAIKECAKEIERRGGEVTAIPLEDGLVNPESVAKAVKENTVLVSVIYANNETGAVNNISKISRLVREKRKKLGGIYPLVHTDAAQAPAYLPVEVSKLGVDLMTLAVKGGAGVLVVRPPRPIRPLILGGGQESGLRGGTENVEDISFFADALEKAVENREKASEKVSKLKEVFIEELKERLPDAVINTPEESLPSIVSVSFPGKLHEFLAIRLDEKGVAVSTGSSCKSLKSDEEHEALRFSFSAETSEREIREAIRILAAIMI